MAVWAILRTKGHSNLDARLFTMEADCSLYALSVVHHPRIISLP